MKQTTQQVLGAAWIDSAISPRIAIVPWDDFGEATIRPGDVLLLTKSRNFGLAQGSRGKYKHRYTLELGTLDEVSHPLAAFEVVGTRPLVLDELPRTN